MLCQKAYFVTLLKERNIDIADSINDEISVQLYSMSVKKGAYIELELRLYETDFPWSINSNNYISCAQENGKAVYDVHVLLKVDDVLQEKVVCAEFLVHRITLKKAIEWGILPTPKIGIFPLKLNEKDINCYYEYKRGEEELQKEIILQREVDKWKYIKNKNLYPNIHLIIYCTEKQKYDQLCYEAEMAKTRWENNKNEKTKNYWLYTIEYFNIS